MAKTSVVRHGNWFIHTCKRSVIPTDPKERGKRLKLSALKQAVASGLGEGSVGMDDGLQAASFRRPLAAFAHPDAVAGLCGPKLQRTKNMALKFQAVDLADQARLEARETGPEAAFCPCHDKPRPPLFVSSDAKSAGFFGSKKRPGSAD